MAAVAMALLLAGCEEEAPSPGTAAAPPPPEVPVATVTPAEVSLTFVYGGRVAGSREVEVRPQVGGLLFRIDRRPYEVALARAQAQLRQAEDNCARQSELFQCQVTSERQRDEALAERDLARAIFPNPDGALLPGQFVHVAVKGISLQDAISVPKKAASQGPQGPAWRWCS